MALLFVTGLMYAGVITGIVLFYVYYTGSYQGQCKLHEFYISFTLVSQIQDGTSGCAKPPSDFI